MITMYNVQNLEVFFETINHFENPVMIQKREIMKKI